MTVGIRLEFFARSIFIIRDITDLSFCDRGKIDVERFICFTGEISLTGDSNISVSLLGIVMPGECIIYIFCQGYTIPCDGWLRGQWSSGIQIGGLGKK